MEQRSSLTCQQYQSHDYLVDLNDLRLDGKLCDITIKVNEKEVRAHKIILASRLKYFKSRLLDQDDDDDVISLEEISEANLESFISFAYTGEILITISNALSLLEDTHRLKETDIKKACINFLEKHLTSQDAAQALELANSIDCFELKIIARQMVPINFQALSQTVEYLSLEYENLKSILFAGEMQLAESQQMFFEGVMKWIMHNVENRREHLNDLLSLVDMTQLTGDYLLEYLSDNIADNDNGGMVKDIMAIYRGKKKQAKVNQIGNSTLEQASSNIELEMNLNKQQSDENDVALDENFARNDTDDNNFTDEQVRDEETDNGDDKLDDTTSYHEADGSEQQTKIKLMLTNMCDNTVIQFYDFSQRTWSELYVIESVDHSTTKSGAILKDKLFYVQSTEVSQEIMQEHLRVIDYRTEECTTLEIRKNNLSGAAVCACARFLYLCGGITEMGQVTRRVQKYNPETNNLEALAPLIIERTGAAAVFYQGSLHVLGGRNRLQITNSVEKYDFDSMMWIAFPSMCKPRRQCAVAILNGKLYACGGQKTTSVEVYDPEVKRWQLVAKMNNARYGFLVIPFEGKLVAIGGDRVGTIEVYDPNEDQWRMDNQMADGLCIRNPIGGIIHSR